MAANDPERDEAADRAFERMKTRQRVLICSAWPPAVGGAASFALRVEQSAAVQARFIPLRHQIVKRPSQFLPSDRRMAGTGLGRIARIASGVTNLLVFMARLLVSRPAIVQYHYNAAFDGALFREVCLYLRLARWAGARTAVRQGGPFHFWELDPGWQQARSVAKRYLRRIDVLVQQTERWRDECARWCAQAGIDLRVIAVPNTVDTRVFSPAEYDVPGEPLRIGAVVGPEACIKGADLILSVIDLLHRKGHAPRLQLHAIGADENFRARVASMGLDEVVVAHGVVSGSARVDWARSLDAFVLSSRQEGFPNILLEVMASGVPVVSTAVGAVPDIVAEGESGFIVPAEDVEAIAARLLELMTDSHRRRAMAAEARRTVEARFALNGGWDERLVAAWDALLTPESGTIPFDRARS